MSQVWNIFRKDARRHWPEIGISLVALAGFAWLDIRKWSHTDSFAATGFSILIASRFLPGLVDALLPISWMFLIVRVVQSESLVGDRQFWITRPYDWKQLIAAKALFVLAFINLPFFIMDIFLLARAGFHPAHHLIGLLWLQLMWILFLFLSAAALATVAKNIPQMLLVVLLIALYMIGMVALSQVIPSADSPSGGDSWSALLLIGTASAVIFLQYSRRKVALSRWLIVGFCALITLMLVATPYRSLVARAYPLPNENLPVQLALVPTAASTCPVLRTSTPPKPGVFAHGTVWGDSDPAEMGISPVHEVDIYLSDWDTSDSNATYPGVCPGTPLILSNPEIVGRSRLELDFKNLSLAEYGVGSGIGRVVVRP